MLSKFCFFSFIVIFILNLSIKAQSYSSLNNIISIQTYELLEINESNHILGNITDMLYSENKFLLLDETKRSISILNKSGEILEDHAREGNGPGEFLAPRNIFTQDNKLFIWDASSLKLIEYDENLSFIREYKELTSYAVSDFIVHEDLFFSQSSGTINGPSIYGTSMEVKNGSINYEYGNKTQAEILFMRIQGNGDIEKDSEYIYYVTPDETILNIIELDTYEKIEVEISFSDFTTPTITNAVDIITTERNTLPEIFSNSSFITNVYPLDDFIVVEAQTGTMNVGFENTASLHNNPYEDRNIELAIFNKNFEQIDLIILDEPEMFSSLIRAHEKNNIYFLFKNSPRFESNYQIRKITIES